MKLLAVVAVLIVSVVAVQGCMSPLSFEGRVFEYNFERGFGVRAHYSYDGMNERTSVYEEVDVNNDRATFHRIHLYQHKVGYWIDLKSKKCTVEQITWDFRPFGTPPNATWEGQAEIGSSARIGAGVLVNLYSEQFASDMYWSADFTEADCLPVSQGIWNSTDKSYTHTSFYDIVEGIEDPNVFIPPKECFTF